MSLDLFQTPLPEAHRPLRAWPRLDTGSVWRAPSELPSLRGVRRLGFDIETKDPTLRTLGSGVRRGGKVVGISLALDINGPRLYLPVGHEGGGNLDERQVKRWARSELNAFAGELVGARLSYDLDYMAHDNWGVTFRDVTRFHDVLVGEPLLDEWRDSYSLDAVSQHHLGRGKVYDHAKRVMERYGLKSEEEYRANLWRLHAADVGEYAEGDAGNPLEILEKQLPLLEEQGLLPVYHLECDLIYPLLEVQRHGVRVDLQRAEEVRERLLAEKAALLARLKHIAGQKAEFTENRSLVPALRERGFAIPKTRPSQHFPEGQDSVTSNWLESHAGDELVDILMEGKKLSTVISTFVEGSILRHNINGRIHCTYNQMKGDDEFGARRGTIARLSATDPNLQQIPARHPVLGPLIRSMFVPDDGEDWVSTDMSQIQYRYLVHYGQGPGAEEARERYRNDPKTDFHNMCGDMLGADATDEFVRKRVKCTNFCEVFGGGDAKLAATFGCSVKEAKEFKKKYHEELPFVPKTFEVASKRARQRGYVVTILKRRQRFPFWEKKSPYDASGVYIGSGLPMSYKDAVACYGEHGVKRAWLHKALNRVLQGSEGDHFKKAVVDCSRAGLYRVLGPPLVLVHDEKCSSKPRTKEGDEAMEELRHIMETCITLNVPVLVKSKVGPNWGSCT